MPTDLYYVYRACERLPGYVRTPLDYYNLPVEEQTRVFAYCMIRDAEEMERSWPKSLA